MESCGDESVYVLEYVEQFSSVKVVSSYIPRTVCTEKEMSYHLVKDDV